MDLFSVYGKPQYHSHGIYKLCFSVDWLNEKAILFTFIADKPIKKSHNHYFAIYHSKVTTPINIGLLSFLKITIAFNFKLCSFKFIIEIHFRCE